MKYDRLIPPEIAECYLEPHRHYHTLEHIYNGLRVLPGLCFEENLDTYAQERVLRAWWAHDAVYVAGSPLNEQHSAELAVKVWKDPEIGDLVMATVYPNTTDPRDMNAQARVLVDADLYGLSQGAAIFDHHTAQVRAEFSMVSQENFDIGRKNFWKNLLAVQQPIYKTLYGQDFWETRALRNMERELAAL